MSAVPVRAATPRSVWRSTRARVAALLLPLVVAVGTAGCAAVPTATPGTPSETASRVATPAATSAGGDDVLLVAVSAKEAGREASWLSDSPVRLWFEPLDGVRTAIVDAPVNVVDVPTAGVGDLLWTGEGAAGSAVGCTRGCDADAFVGRITSRPAHQSWAAGVLTVTAGRDSIVFAPTAAPLPEHSGCDPDSIDFFPCGRLVSVSGTAGGTVLEALRTDPLTVSITGSGDRRSIRILGGAETITAPIRITGGSARTAAGSAETTGSCPSSGGECAGVSAVAALFSGPVVYAVHASSILVSGAAGTLQLEAA